MWLSAFHIPLFFWVSNASQCDCTSTAESKVEWTGSPRYEQAVYREGDLQALQTIKHLFQLANLCLYTSVQCDSGETQQLKSEQCFPHMVEGDSVGLLCICFILAFKIPSEYLKKKKKTDCSGFQEWTPTILWQFWVECSIHVTTS